MKWCFIILFIITVAPAFSQQNRRIPNNETITPFVLAQQLTSSCSTDVQKVKAIFYWITENISYRTKAVSSRKRTGPIYDEADDTAALKPLDERVAETVLENRVAICDGYARLFKTLCLYSGIQAEVVTGFARTESGKSIQRFQPNHSWNAVLIDSIWRLLDVTWASGYITWQGGEFVRQLDEQYFLAPPQQFIREHYPDDLRWTLMTNPPLMPEFRHSPFKQKSFIKYNITTYKPERGVIEALQGDTIQIELETANAQKDQQISSDPFLDTTLYSTATSALLLPAARLAKKTLYTYIANSPLVEWLYVLYNEDVVLRYKLQIKNTIPENAVGDK